MADFVNQIDDAMMEAAKSLFELSNSRDSFNSQSGFVKNGAKKLNSQDLGEHSRKKRNKIIKKNFRGSFNSQDIGEHSRKKRIKIIKKNVDGRLDSDNEISRKKRKRKYECNVCKRTFKSHQTLGGHMTTHRKDVRKGLEDSNSSENKPANIKEARRIKIINFGKSKREEDDEKELEDSNSFENKSANTTGIKRIKIINFGKSKGEEDGEKGLEDSDSLENKPANTTETRRIKIINCGKSKREEDCEKDLEADSNSSENNPTGKIKVFCGQSKKEKDYKCPFCPRIFTSGQALGGHKRSHLRGGIKLNLDTERSKIDKK
ncbi:unnamed protein product [Amaranthus hypochondriacus]